MAEVTCRYKPGQNVTAKADGAAIIGGRFVSITDALSAEGDYQAAHTAAGARAFGVAEYGTEDPTAAGANQRDSIFRTNVVRRGAIARVEAGEAITAGALIAAGANGVAVVADTPGDVILGVACTSVTGPGDFVEVDLILGAAVVPGP